MHFQRGEHFAKFPAGKVKGQFHNQSRRVFDRREKGVHRRYYLSFVRGWLENLAAYTNDV